MAQNTVHVELPEINPFGNMSSIAPGRNNNRNRNPPRRVPPPEDESDDYERVEPGANATVLPAINPFAGRQRSVSPPPRARKPARQAAAAPRRGQGRPASPEPPRRRAEYSPPPARRERAHAPYEEEVYSEEEYVDRDERAAPERRRAIARSPSPPPPRRSKTLPVERGFEANTRAIGGGRQARDNQERDEESMRGPRVVSTRPPPNAGDVNSEEEYSSEVEGAPARAAGNVVARAAAAKSRLQVDPPQQHFSTEVSPEPAKNEAAPAGLKGTPSIFSNGKAAFDLPTQSLNEDTPEPMVANAATASLFNARRRRDEAEAESSTRGVHLGKGKQSDAFVAYAISDNGYVPPRGFPHRPRPPIEQEYGYVGEPCRCGRHNCHGEHGHGHVGEPCRCGRHSCHGEHHPREEHHRHEHRFPPWFPPWFPPQYTLQWPGCPPHPYGQPVFADIPKFPSLIDQIESSYYALPAPPLNVLRELQEEREGKIPGVPEPAPRSQPDPTLNAFSAACDILDAAENPDERTVQGKTYRFLDALSYRELNPYFSDQITRLLSNAIQVRFAERKGDEIVNRTRLVPRGRLGLGVILDARTKLDYDLIIPGDFIMNRWRIGRKTASRDLPKTIVQALDLSPATIARGEIDAERLDWVIQSVWDQLNGSADAFIFPGGFAEAPEYLSMAWCALWKMEVAGANRLRLVTTGRKDIRFINIYIKVAVSVNGQDMVVGVDYSGAQVGDKHQMTKKSPAPGVPLGETPLHPVDRSAIIMLNWWKRDLKHSLDTPGGVDPATYKFRTNHFILALAALHDLDPTNELYVPRARAAATPFSLEQMLDTARKILVYLTSAYNSPLMIAVTTPETDRRGSETKKQYLFPLWSCTTMDALYTQAMLTPNELPDLLQVISVMIIKLEATIAKLKGGSGTGGNGAPSTKITIGPIS